MEKKAKSVRKIAVFQHLAESGIEVYSFDVHGHGKSEPTDKNQRALVWRFHDLVRSAACMSSIQGITG